MTMISSLTYTTYPSITRCLQLGTATASRRVLRRRLSGAAVGARIANGHRAAGREPESRAGARARRGRECTRAAATPAATGWCGCGRADCRANTRSGARGPVSGAAARARGCYRGFSKWGPTQPAVKLSPTGERRGSSTSFFVPAVTKLFCKLITS